jgi:hypothetical protein
MKEKIELTRSQANRIKDYLKDYLELISTHCSLASGLQDQIYKDIQSLQDKIKESHETLHRR